MLLGFLILNILKQSNSLTLYFAYDLKLLMFNDMKVWKDFGINSLQLTIGRDTSITPKRMKEV